MAAAKKIDKAGLSTLRTLYCDKRLSISEIVKKTGYPRSSVHRYLKEAGASTRDRSTATREGISRKPRPRGANHPRFKHGLTSEGYASENARGRVELSHRLTAERVLGRLLARQEVVHHCNGIKTDNRPENLWVFPSHSHHARFHKTGVIHPDTIFLKDHRA